MSIFGKVWEHFRQGLREFLKSIFGKVSGILVHPGPSCSKCEARATHERDPNCVTCV